MNNILRKHVWVSVSLSYGACKDSCYGNVGDTISAEHYPRGGGPKEQEIDEEEDEGLEEGGRWR
jgi:hypothetical protein